MQGSKSSLSKSCCCSVPITRWKTECEGRFLHCSSAGLRPAWSFEGFSISGQFLVVKSSAGACSLLRGCCLGCRLDTCITPFGNHRNSLGAGKIVQGLRSCAFTRQQNRGDTVEVVLYLTPGWDGLRKLRLHR